MYNSDRPLTDRLHDELGLAAVADAVAARIIDLQPEDGLVVGLQSPWGMGKSTFLNFLTQKIEEEPSTIVVRFAPWLVDDRNALLHELFAEMSRSIEPREKKKSQRWDVAERRQRQATANRLRQFARIADRLKSLPELPHLSWVKDALNLPVARETGAITGFIVSCAAAFKPKDETLRELKQDIATRLILLKQKIIIIIDDVDRLDLSEAKEVFRLIRAVADFPNTTYIVAFDREPIGFDLDHEADIGRSYLDKIVQVPLVLPKPEPVDLRRILTKALMGDQGRLGVVGRPLRQTNNPYRSDSEAQRVAGVIDALVRTYLNSPRRIGIINNVMMTLWPDVSDDVDLSDYLVHLCLVNFDRPLARWVDDYLAVRSTRHRRGSDPSRTAALRSRLDDILDSAQQHREDRLMILRSILPSIRGY
ncbi:P-loop NTPase fold protein [Brevundimonas sp.]|uniref:KAP family P-loop NTPase fold protein n=1 Tax=Brevundimonas sp. TaxID=1871086 RepID=UPI002869F5E1|nr:P-loop NTPase fold protein [Brevundimonas sp.]